jgi:hypothetical protein
LDAPADSAGLIFKASSLGSEAGMDTKMIQNRELSMDDYLAMFRRRARSILIPALFGPLLDIWPSCRSRSSMASTRRNPSS